MFSCIYNRVNCVVILSRITMCFNMNNSTGLFLHITHTKYISTMYLVCKQELGEL